MLDVANTSYFHYTEELVANDSLATIVEGSPLVMKVEDGLGKVSLGSGSNSEVFVGVAHACFIRPVELTMTQEIVVDANSLTVALARKPLADKLSAYDVEAKAKAKATIASDAPAAPAAGEVQFTAGTGEENGTVTFNASDAGKQFNITYRYANTIAEGRAVAGDGVPSGMQLGELNKSTGCIHSGRVATDQFDIESDWTAADINDIKVNVDGRFARGGTGAPVTNARVLAAPGIMGPYLILQLL